MIPERVYEGLSDSYTDEGVRQAWQARWRTLGGRRMCDVWAEDPERVMGAIESFNSGDFI